MSIRASDWNDLGRKVCRAKALEGRNVRLDSSVEGVMISSLAQAEWQHPWTLSPSWNDRQQEWRCTIKPGFVNGYAPVARLTAAEAPAATLARRMALKQATTPETLVVEAPLHDEPQIPLQWKALGVDGASADGVPQFFRDRGVNLATASGEESGDLQTIKAPPGNRLLRKCDLILHQPRRGLLSQVSTSDGLATGQAQTTVTLTLSAIDPSDALRVYASAEGLAPDSAGIPGTGDYVEPPYDELVIGTVYLLSPADAAPHSGPDQTWQPYVAHALFWNLNYAQPQFLPAAGAPGNPLLVPLAGGAAQSIINEFTSLIDDAVGEAEQFLAAQSMQGFFWAATGGGSDGRFPPETAQPAAGLTGLDKDGRLQAERAAAEQAILQEQLDPAFPYYAPIFNLALLTR